MKHQIMNISTTCCLALALIGSAVVARQSIEPEKSESNLFALVAPAYCIAAHRIGQMHLAVTNNGTIGSAFFPGLVQDCFTGADVPSCEYPIGSNQTYLFGGGYWIGAVVGSDTLVSEGVDGWSRSPYEFNPDAAPFGNMIHRSTLDTGGIGTESAVSHEDYISVFTDTINPDVSYPPDYFGRSHMPIDIEVTEASYAWSYPHTEDFVLFDYQIKNIGQETLSELYFGIYVDGDVYQSQISTGFQDDFTGFIGSAPSSFLPVECQFEDTLNAVWVADNDGDLSDPLSRLAPHVTGVRLIATPDANATLSYNWWRPDLDAQLDYGPMRKDNIRDLQTGGTGTPEGDINKYFYLRNGEIDFDQAYLYQAEQTDTVWQYPSSVNAADWSTGVDARYLLSVGPFTIQPGQSLPLVFAYVGGMDLHTDPGNFANLPNDPDAYYAGLDFSDFNLNAAMAGWIYDHPGVDSDSDGYAGKFRVCCDTLSGECDTMFYEGDGIPDYRPFVIPKQPVLWAEPFSGGVHLRWNGLRSETSRDLLTGKDNFEGYNAYLATSPSPADFAVYAAYDLENFSKHIFDFASNEWVIREYPFTAEELRCLYGDSCNDGSFDPLVYTESNPYVIPGSPDSIFYFTSFGRNTSELGVATPIIRSYPGQPYPSTLDPDAAAPSELTDDGYLKYFEYELTIDNLLSRGTYWVNVTATDIGNPFLQVLAQESAVADSALMLDVPTDVGDPSVGTLPSSFALEQNFPNPFNPSTTISYSLPHRSKVTLTVYNMIGQQVALLVDAVQPAGDHDIVWSGLNDSGEDVASGVYLYRLSAGEKAMARTMILLK